MPRAIQIRATEAPHPAAGELDHPATAQATAHATRDLPRLVELLPRQTPGAAHRTPHAIEQAVARKARQVERGEPGMAPVRERHASL